MIRADDGDEENGEPGAPHNGPPLLSSASWRTDSGEAGEPTTQGDVVGVDDNCQCCRRAICSDESSTVAGNSSGGGRRRRRDRASSLSSSSFILESPRQGLSSSSKTVRMSGAELLYCMLTRRGITEVFGYSGGAVLPFLDQFYCGGKEKPPIRFVNTAHEAAAAHAAQAQGRLKRGIGVCVVTSGPGMTNCVTALQDSLVDGDPLVLLSGQVATTVIGTDAFQECPATAITSHCTKWNYLCLDVESLPAAINTAFEVAVTGRMGPVHVDLPKNVLTGVADFPVEMVFGRDRLESIDDDEEDEEDDDHETDHRVTTPTLNFTRPDYPADNWDDVEKTARLIANAERPIIIAGKGAAMARAPVRKFAELTNIPVVMTLHGLGVLPSDHRLALGMFGMHGHVAANTAVQNADVVISLGSRFDDRATGNVSKFAPKACAAAALGTGGIIACEIDPRAVKATLKPHFTVQGDCSEVLQRWLTRIPTKMGSDSDSPWLTDIERWRSELEYARDDSGIPSNELNCPIVVEALSRYCNGGLTGERDPVDVTVCTGVGCHQMFTAQYFDLSRPNQLVASGGLGTMGVGLPFAVGVQVTMGMNHKVLLIDGDGSFNMSASELATIVDHKLPIKIALMNDGHQSMVRTWQTLFFKKRYIASKNANPDYVQLATAYGVAARACSRRDELAQCVAALMESEGPMLVDFRIHSTPCFPFVRPGCGLDDMLLCEPPAAEEDSSFSTAAALTTTTTTAGDDVPS